MRSVADPIAGAFSIKKLVKKGREKTMTGATLASSPLLFILAIAVTGLAESFRSVSITPAAQRTLPPQDIAIGTGLINFMNSLAPVIASASMGVVYNMQIVADPTNVENIQRGVRSVFLLAATVLTVGFIVVLTVVRPLMTKNAEEK